MVKEYIIKDDIYINLLRYFKGDIIYLDTNILKDLKIGMFEGKPVRELDKAVLKTFVSILKLKKQKPDIYAEMKWIYPEWDKDEQEKRLRGYFPEDYEEEEVEVKEVEEEEGSTYSPSSPKRNLIQPKDGDKYSFEEQVEILINFYSQHDPKKSEEDIDTFGPSVILGIGG